MCACDLGNIEIVDTLVRSGADVNKVRQGNESPLTYAVQGGYDNIVQYLIHAGAYVKHRQWNENTSLHLAISLGLSSIASLLLDAEEEMCNMKGAEGNTPLHLAVTLKNKDMITLLLIHNADLEARNNEGNRPVDIAENLKLADIELVSRISLLTKRESSI